ncbi:glycoside hydrolase/deacetylase [Meredithblackwellia eburnea MCA 4105]
MKLSLSTLVTLASLLSLSASTPVPADEREPTLEERSVGLVERSASVIEGCTVPGTFAMTFDDGPLYGGQIATFFNQHNVKATFFVNGNNYDCIYDYASDIQARYAAGHQIAAHTWTHPDITTLTATRLNQEITLLETALLKIIGVKPKYFRPPYGSYNQAAVNIITSRGYKIVTWNFDSGDSVGATPAQSITSYTKYTNLGTKKAATMAGINALNHETYTGTANKVVPTVVPKLIAAGWKLVTVAQCMNDPQPYQTVTTASKKDKTWTCAGTPAGRARF